MAVPDEQRSIWVFNPLALNPLAYVTAVWAGAAWAATEAAGAIAIQAVLRANPAWLGLAAEVLRGARDG